MFTIRTYSGPRAVTGCLNLVTAGSSQGGLHFSPSVGGSPRILSKQRDSLEAFIASGDSGRVKAVSPIVAVAQAMSLVQAALSTAGASLTTTRGAGGGSFADQSMRGSCHKTVNAGFMGSNTILGDVARAEVQAAQSARPGPPRVPASDPTAVQQRLGAMDPPAAYSGGVDVGRESQGDGYDALSQALKIRLSTIHSTDSSNKT